MAWQQIKIDTNANAAEKIGDFLSDNGAKAVSFVDAKDTPMYEPQPGESHFWPDTRVIGLYELNEDLSRLIERLLQLCKPSDLYAYKLDQLEDKDWTRVWMDDYHPMRFGKRLWICPSWCEPPMPDAVNIMLDPGLAFGTGTHPTTSLCLQWLDAHQIQGKTVVDFGCGSGVLAVAAAKLGAQRVVAVDIDQQAIIATQQNAKNNAVGNLISTHLNADMPKLAADIVIANILAGPLKSLKPVLTSFCKRNTQLILSGILDEQSDALISHYEDEFSLLDIVVEQEWARITLIRT